MAISPGLNGRFEAAIQKLLGDSDRDETNDRVDQLPVNNPYDPPGGNPLLASQLPSDRNRGAQEQIGNNSDGAHVGSQTGNSSGRSGSSVRTPPMVYKNIAHYLPSSSGSGSKARTKNKKDSGKKEEGAKKSADGSNREDELTSPQLFTPHLHPPPTKKTKTEAPKDEQKAKETDHQSQVSDDISLYIKKEETPNFFRVIFTKRLRRERPNFFFNWMILTIAYLASVSLLVVVTALLYTTSWIW
uniref:Uncharacterized protein n=1 Tax=Steinernema glaseri TaxID=37863 RepID=A0A1I7YTW1_9BILA